MPLPPSASDWTRFKKLNSAVGYGSQVLYDLDIRGVVTPGSCNPCLSNRQAVRTDRDRIVGSSRTRREASKWVDFVASQRTDFVTVSQIDNRNPDSRQLNRTQICANGSNCVITIPFRTGQGICTRL
jgi:hypothetical protein